MFSRGQTEQEISAGADLKGPGTALIARGCNDRLDHFPQCRLGGLCHHAVGCHCSFEILDLAPESVRQVRKQGDDLRTAGYFGNGPIRLSLALFQLDELGTHCGSIGAIGDGGDQAFDLALQPLCLLGQAELFLAAIPALFHEALPELDCEGLERILVEQGLLETGNHPLFEARGIELASAVTTSPAAVGAAGHVLLVGNDHGTAADTAPDQAGQQALWTPRALGSLMTAIAYGPGAQPGFLIDDAQLGNVGHLLLGLGIEALVTLADGRVTAVGADIPDQAAYVDLVAEDPCAALTVTENGARRPGGSGAGRDALCIQTSSNLSRCHTVRIF